MASEDLLPSEETAPSEAEELELRHLLSLRLRLLRVTGDPVGHSPPVSVPEARRQVEALLQRARGHMPHAQVADLAGRRQLQAALGQNERIRRLVLRVHGVAPEVSEETRRLLEDSAPSPTGDAADRKQLFHVATARVTAQSLLLLRMLRAEEALTRTLYADMRRLASLYKQLFGALAGPSERKE